MRGKPEAKSLKITALLPALASLEPIVLSPTDANLDSQPLHADDS